MQAQLMLMYVLVAKVNHLHKLENTPPLGVFLYDIIIVYA